MAEPVRLIFPIGRSNGAVYEEPGADVDCYGIQYGWNTYDLSWDHFQVWNLAHGELPAAERIPWTRDEILKRATKAGIKNPSDIIDGLVDAQILQEIKLNTPDAIEFAQTHRLLPQLFALGNTSKTPWLYQLGLPDKPLMQISDNFFDLWKIGNSAKHLWDAIEALVDASKHSGQTAPEDTDPIVALNGLLEGIHALIAAGCFSFEPIAGDWRDQI